MDLKLQPVAENPLVKAVVDLALKEDETQNDITSAALIPDNLACRALIQAKSAGVLAGLPLAEMVFSRLDERLEYKPLVNEGDRLRVGEGIVEVNGRLRSVMAGERVALNFLQRLSGIATLTAEYVEAVSEYKAVILDTRKTTPGLRLLEKYAVSVGGGANHRLNLAAAVLIKDNHLKAVDLKSAVQLLAQKYQVEVEVETLAELREALAAGADIVLLDNMDIEQLRAAVAVNEGRALLEASGGITLKNVKAVAATGVDRISVGAITQAAPPLDIALNVLTVDGMV